MILHGMMYNQANVGNFIFSIPQYNNTEKRSNKLFRKRNIIKKRKSYFLANGQKHVLLLHLLSSVKFENSPMFP
ncbi:hypothetical protein EB796_002524 [Bugula neritina]|uniref:Uncharacterized protein n=1 Tax=Bugula neritina TaxID=10212 RepID=A0A7J7KLZ5_BUGNE|nr:hypothetical protein EB796_002524 [Bugula neritina]